MKIMLVDDESGLCSAMGLIIRGAGYSYCYAKDGFKALALFDEEAPDLVIMDVMMPGLDGFELCHLLREKNARVPLLMLSAKGDIGDKKVGFKSGADDYLTKPFNEEELLLRIEALLRRASLADAAPDAASSITRIGDLVIDGERREVSVCGSFVALTVKEFQIIELLAKNPGKVFTREDIIERVWGSEYDRHSVSIPVYVRRIRKKLERDPSNPRYLQTVWRFGYRLGD